MKSFPIVFCAATTAFLGAASCAYSLSMAPPRPLAERVGEAEKVFVGTLLDRVEEGDWVRAELRVDTALRGVKEKEQVEVIWRKRLGDFEVYDAPEGKRGVAILKDKHEGRYWLRADKFEPLDRLEEVKKCLAGGKDEGVPTFDEWVKAGKPIPEGRMFTGGTPWFNESTGKQRSAEEVYEMIYGKPAAVKDKPAAGGRFPAHWGDPPRIQTRDIRPLPGGYGQGSSTLAGWIKLNMEKDARRAEEGQ